VVQDDDHGVVLQSTMDGHTITVDPQINSQLIGVPVLQIYGSPYNEVVDVNFKCTRKCTNRLQ
jgi:hypothetical protein